MPDSSIEPAKSQRRNGASLRLLLLLAALLAALLLKGAAVTLAPVRIDNAPGAFDATRAVARLARILGDERPHPVDSAANDLVRQRLLAEIESLGIVAQVRDDFSCKDVGIGVSCARVRNIVFRVGPKGGDATMIAAHYDSVPAGPGASDDGIGVATSLEIAALLVAQPPPHPVVFLFTDGEEAGLLGAKSFVDSDPLASDVARVINLEARGVRGPALMFETATPNAADVRAFATGAQRPFANSMMADIYKLMPNSTDATEFLPKGYGTINLALSEGLAYYHTPLDSLANQDPRSVQHMGDLVFGSLQATFKQAAEGPAASVQLAYTDLVSRALLVVPQWLAFLLIATGGLVASIVFWRAGGARPVRALLAPPATLLATLLLSWAASLLFDHFRTEAAYWYALPIVFQATAYLCAATAALLSLALIGNGVGRARLVASSWIWLAAIGAGISFIAPGASILFALPLAAFALSGLASFRSPKRRAFGPCVAALAALIVFAPPLHLAELALGFGVLAIPALVAALVFMVALPLACGGETRLPRAPVFAVAIMSVSGLLLVFLVAGLRVPAYSPAQPRPLSLQYLLDADQRTGQWIVGTEPAPAAMQAVAPFDAREFPGMGLLFAAPAAYAEPIPPRITVLRNSYDGGIRRVRFSLEARDWDRIRLLIPAEAGAIRLVTPDATLAFAEKGPHWFFCSGRACAKKEFEIELKNGKPTEWLIHGMRYQLPASAAPLLKARPDWATPIGDGDATAVSMRVGI